MLEVLRSGQLSLGPRVPAFEEAFAERRRRAPRVRGLLRHDRAAPGAARGRRRGGRRGGHVAVLVRRDRQRRRSTRAPRRCSPTSTRSRSTSTRRRRGGDHRAARARCCRSTSSATRPTCPRSSATGCRSSRTPPRRSARATPTAAPVGGRGHPAIFGFYANKQMTTGEGGMITLGSAEQKERIDSERNQGRAPDMGWLDHDRLGFNYRLSDIACALGLAQLERLDDMLAARARVAGWYREALAGLAARARAGAAVRGRRRRRARLVRVRRAAAARRRPRRHGARAARARRAVQAVPAGDPPDVVLPRALRAPAGRVPGLRARRGRVAGAAVLPGR